MCAETRHVALGDRVSDEIRALPTRTAGDKKEQNLRSRAQSLESTIRAYEKVTGFSDKAACPICNGIEGCSHTFSERYRAHSTADEGALVEALAKSQRVLEAILRTDSVNKPELQQRIMANRHVFTAHGKGE